MEYEKNHIAVLVVDDENYIRDIVVRWLNAEGYQCEQAEDGPEALQR